MNPITRLIIRIAHGDEILAVFGAAIFALIIAAAVNQPIPQ